MVYVFEFIGKSPEDDNSVIVIDGDLRGAVAGSTLTGYCSEDSARHDFSLECVDPSRGLWRVDWANHAGVDTLLDLNAVIALGDIITRVPDGARQEWDYVLKEIR